MVWGLVVGEVELRGEAGCRVMKCLRMRIVRHSEWKVAMRVAVQTGLSCRGETSEVPEVVRIFGRDMLCFGE
jgi:hypothetical protein